MTSDAPEERNRDDTYHHLPDHADPGGTARPWVRGLEAIYPDGPKEHRPGNTTGIHAGEDAQVDAAG